MDSGATPSTSSGQRKTPRENHCELTPPQDEEELKVKHRPLPSYAYQWQDLSDNVAFANIPFTAATLPAAATVPNTYYRVVITPNDSHQNGVPFITSAVFAVADTDADGVPDATDNCPTSSNPGQADLDSDGLGDACDDCPSDPLNDADGDGVCGDTDNCPSVANPSQTDLDGDGLGNVCDPDLDGDGLPNDWETDHGLDPGDASDVDSDDDGDGFTAGEEFTAQTDPQDPGSALRITHVEFDTAGHTIIEWSSVGGVRYRVQYCDGKAGGGFDGVFTEIVRSPAEETDPGAPGVAGTMQFTDDFSLTGGPLPHSSRFFSIQVVP